MADLTLSAPDVEALMRMGAAALVGAIVGMDRERQGKPAGLRTHMLVAGGAALFVVAASEVGMPTADMSRVIQGVAAGIGFLGAGAILKLSDTREIRGLTTAATIWMRASCSVPYMMPLKKQRSTNLSPLTPFATPSPPTSSRTVMTFAPSRSCSGTRMSRPP